MSFLSPLCKPEFWFRPVAYLTRRRRAKGRPGERVSVRLPWGLAIQVQPEDTIGRQILTFGLFELPVSEALWRLVRAGDAVADVGANMGYMTGLMSFRAGPTGSVDAFEPHPHVFELLGRHAAAWAGNRGMAPMRLHRVAAGDHEADVLLFDEGEGGDNCGLGSLVQTPDRPRSFPVPLVRLDGRDSFKRPVGVLKIDVEGAEDLVVAGLSGALRARLIRDVVFEDQSEAADRARGLLAEAGYTLFSIGLDLFGPRLVPFSEGRPRLRSWDSPNTLATLDPEGALESFRARGWQCLRGRSRV